ncbi:hypothetical protein C2845_PM02G01040 [Panicum miliaceum]|uniref:non-specific serine/threonine protein kinase n=1 Tax=Panicum miliaceum TaxID=4540 RepID=A0A3L6SDB8_PANMI|nr:hypothetical protein C2845_PM02G01040 [Panicum miliaceum]
MDREDAEEGSAPKRHKRSHHRHHHGGSDPEDAPGAEGRAGAASLAPGEAGEGAIALDEGAAAADAGRALAPAPLLKKFGSDVGLKLTAVRMYSKQLFIALKHLKSCNVLHCDIKPDNVLVNEAKTKLKLCDFGSAMSAGMNEITPYLVSRFYRAPEIILGLPYDHPLDMWSVGCSLFELYSGKVLFPGKTNNDMLPLHMESKGTLPKKMLRKGTFAKEHFDQDFNYFDEKDPVTKMTVKKHPVMNIKRQDLSSFVSSFPGEDPKMLSNFNDLLKRILVLDPEKRLKVEQALSHSFVSGE